MFTSLFSFQAEADNHRLKSAHWGGPLQDIGIYCLNAVRHVFEDEPTEVMATRNVVDDPRFAEVEETIAATLKFPKGRLAQFCASFGADDLDMYRIAGTAGEIRGRIRLRLSDTDDRAPQTRSRGNRTHLSANGPVCRPDGVLFRLHSERHCAGSRWRRRSCGCSGAACN